VGIGNRWRGDDAAGLLAADRLRRRIPEAVSVQSVEGDLSELLEIFQEAEAVFLLDACVCGARPGTLHRFLPLERSLPSGIFRTSTHALGVAEVIGVAIGLGIAPDRLVVYGIEGGTFTPGSGLSPGLDVGVDLAVRMVSAETQALL